MQGSKIFYSYKFLYKRPTYNTQIVSILSEKREIHRAFCKIQVKEEKYGKYNNTK